MQRFEEHFPYRSFSPCFIRCFFIIIIFTKLVVCFVLCFLFNHSGIFLNTGSSLCVSSTFAFVPSLGSPLALSQTHPKCFEFCMSNPSLQEIEYVTASAVGLGNPKMGCPLNPVLKNFLSTPLNVCDYSGFPSGWEHSKTGWLMSSFQSRVSRLSCCLGPRLKSKLTSHGLSKKHGDADNFTH